MYQPIEGGKCVHVQGLDCWLPPEGYVYNIITKKLEYRGVWERSEDAKEQYWERPQLPLWYKDVMKEWDDYDSKKKETEPDFYDVRLEEFKRQEWDRRLNGFWFRNNGEAVYLTGTHYLYLMWWPIDIGYPKFRIPDLEKAYFMQYCIEDPKCMGMVEVTKRRFGKSFWAGVFLTEYVTRTKMTNAGIQSKTGADAKKFFSKTVVNPFRRLPKFFRPVYDDSLGVNPKSEMRFQRPNVKGKRANQNVGEDELGSIIDWGSSEEVAYDGQKLHRYVADEVAKTKGVDVYNRHEVVRYCLLDDEGRVIGKALYTTTVEKIEGEDEDISSAFKLLWDESDQLRKGEDGMTGSGLYRFFMSAKRTRNFDPYGHPDEALTEKMILLDREKVKNNPRSLAARIRKEPLTIDEAFLIDSENCVFNILNIQKREKELSEKPVHLRKVQFYRDFDGTVKWRDANQNSEFHWEITWFPKVPNKRKKVGIDFIPDNTRDGAITVDSYSSSQGGRKYGSKASAWIGRRIDLSDTQNSFKAVGHLYGRPKVKEELHEQVMLASEYYGYQAWYEHAGGDDYFSYFRERGKLAYLGLYPVSAIKPEDRGKAERLRGFPVTPFSLTKQLDCGIAYFENYCHKIDYPILLKFAKDFDPYDRTKFDCVVSFMMLIVVLTEPLPQQISPSEPFIKEYFSQQVEKF
jgi:hypothetical protein